MKVGLRFKRSEHSLLRATAHRAAVRELPEAVSLFNAAADAATTGEPMILQCVDTDEARRVAHGFTRYGILEPTIEAVSQDA